MMSGARRLPLPPPVTLSQLRAIEAGLVLAWARTRTSIDTSTANELTLNAALADRLNELLAEGTSTRAATSWKIDQT